MNHKLSVFTVFVLISALLSLAACGALAGSPSTSGVGLLPMATKSNNAVALCVTCAQATVAAAQIQMQTSADADAAATAEVMRANAQETLDAANATLSAAQTQEQSNANIIAAQIAATVEIMRANAQATLVAAGSTQNAALTQDAIRQTQVQSNIQITAALATQNAIATVTQQNSNFLAAGTQTSVANTVATQTQSAVATTQWYADQVRLRDEQRQAPLTFLWLWGPPLFIMSLGLLGLLFFWRWMKIRETQQRIDMQPAVLIEIKPEPRPLRTINNNQYQQLTKPTDHARRWLEEVKHKLIAAKKDDDDNPDS